jgi:alpha-1,2-mannosyltransferase
VRHRLDVRRFQKALRVVAVLSVAATLAIAIDHAVMDHEVDFSVYLMGARQVFTGHLYTTFLASPKKPFTYPPVAALLFIPFRAVPQIPAQVIWAVISTILLIGFLMCSLRAVRPNWPRSEAILWSCILSLPALELNPVALTFGFGQVNVLLGLLVLADLTGEYTLKGRTIPRGVMTGIAAAIKVTPLVFVPFLFATKQFRAGWTALITFVGCAVVMFAVAPGESWSYWTKYLFDAKRVGGVVYISNQSLRSTIVRFSHAHASEHAIVLVVALTGIAGLSVAIWAYRVSSPLLGILVCAVTGLLVSPITWAHHLVWVVPIVLWLVLGADRPAFGRLWAALVAGLFWYGAIWHVPHGSARELHDTVAQLIEGNSYTIAMVVFVIGVAVMLTLRRSPQTSKKGELLRSGVR